MNNPALILGSSSAYRRQILDRLGIHCVQISPDVDETIHQAPSPRDLAKSLASLKARDVARQLAQSDDMESEWLVIGSDQVCHCDGEQFSKPGSPENAERHLAHFSGRWVTFSTGLCLVASTGQEIALVEDFACRFRTLSIEVIKRYVALDNPIDCAGAIKAEGGGLALMDDTKGRDINTLLGLPVMLLTESMARLGYRIFDFR